MQEGDYRKECCKQQHNLFECHRSHDMVVYECAECKCKHWEVTVDVTVLSSQAI